MYKSRSQVDNCVRVGVIGYGYWGSKHARVLAGIPGVELMVIESEQDKRCDAATAFPAVHRAACLGEVTDMLDAVVIATPPWSHSSIALQALEAGLHTLVEKPMATSVEDAEALSDAADARGLTLMVGHTFEYHAAVWKIRQIITSGALGRILYVDTARLQSGPGPRKDCNVIWDLAPHDISIASYLLDEFPEAVVARAEYTVGDIQPDVAYLRMEFPHTAAPAFAHVSWLSPVKVRRITVVGDQKMLVYNDLSNDEPINIYDVDVDIADLDGAPLHLLPKIRTDTVASVEVQWKEPLLVQDSHFIDCVRTGRPPESSGERGIGVVRVLVATDDAVAVGTPDAIRPPSVGWIPPTVVDTQAAS
ncbi:Gfo/Idh/MocA family protein [Mycobacterium aquaticum]|uniref:Oxidoreductase n=1 Tax=Mycobacterium aquaticum TaxID=1927124 RepID=A0A1X0AAA2_9MYCO|nr:Gfo/Idh/MocA family oxidoreductase [Mycobacterium aquaticum]ORA26997.1 hypothetical protein BST13_31135 [Mycobacterium aquaticum]